MKREQCPHGFSGECWDFCMASCCHGATHLGTRREYFQHHAQDVLDGFRFNVGYFGEKHQDVLHVLVELMERYGATFFQVQNILEGKTRGGPNE